MAGISKNFTQAMKELTGFDENESSSEQNRPVASSNVIEHLQREEHLGRPETREKIQIPPFDDSTGSRITSTMLVKGKIETVTPIQIDGKISGNIEGKSTMMVIGTVVGDIAAKEIAITGAVKGNVKAEGNIDISQQAVVVGNAKAENVAIKGKLKGNIDVGHVTEVSENAMVSGDIVTDKLISAGGCFVGGSITTREKKSFDFDEDKLFNFGG